MRAKVRHWGTAGVKRGAWVPKPRRHHLKAAMQHLAFEAEPLARSLRAWHATEPGCGVLALVPEAQRGRLPLLQQACREHALPLAGAIFPALVSGAAFTDSGLWLLRLPRGAGHWLLPDLAADAEAAAAQIAQAVEPALAAPALAGGKPTLYLVFDGLIGNIASVLDALYLRLADRVDYAGVNAGSETFQPMPCVFDGERVVGHGVLVLLLPEAERTWVEHGYPVPERVMTATATVGNCIQSIDWRPAFDVYQAIIGEEYGIALTRENFYQYAVHFPVGILRASDDVVVRIPVALSEDGGLVCIGEVPENAVLTLLRAPGVDTGLCIGRLAAGLGGGRQALQGGVLLTFYCAGRRLHLGDDALTELQALQAQTGAAVMGGALSLGEIGNTQAWGYPMFHNATLVCTPWR